MTQRKAAILIELMVAVVILGTALLAIYMSIIYAGTLNQRARNANLAQQIASQEIEILRVTPFASITAPYNGAFIGSPQAVSQILPSGTSNLTVSYYDSPTNKQKKAVVTVSWRERIMTRSIVYTTLLVSGGLNP